MNHPSVFASAPTDGGGAGQRLGQGIAAAATERGPHNPFDFIDTAERYGTATVGAAWDGSWNVPQRGLVRQGIEAAVDNPLVRNVGSAIGDAQAQSRQQASVAAGRIAPDFNARAAAAQQKYFPQLPDVKPAATPVNAIAPRVAPSHQTAAPGSRSIQLPDLSETETPAPMVLPETPEAAAKRRSKEKLAQGVGDANTIPPAVGRAEPADFPTFSATGTPRPRARMVGA